MFVICSRHKYFPIIQNICREVIALRKKAPPVLAGYDTYSLSIWNPRLSRFSFIHSLIRQYLDIECVVNVAYSSRENYKKKWNFETENESNSFYLIYFNFIFYKQSKNPKFMLNINDLYVSKYLCIYFSMCISLIQYNLF